MWEKGNPTREMSLIERILRRLRQTTNEASVPVQSWRKQREIKYLLERFIEPVLCLYRREKVSATWALENRWVLLYFAPDSSCISKFSPPDSHATSLSVIRVEGGKSNSRYCCNLKPGCSFFRIGSCCSLYASNAALNRRSGCTSSLPA